MVATASGTKSWKLYVASTRWWLLKMYPKRGWLLRASSPLKKTYLQHTTFKICDVAWHTPSYCGCASLTTEATLEKTLSPFVRICCAETAYVDIAFKARYGKILLAWEQWRTRRLRGVMFCKWLKASWSREWELSGIQTVGFRCWEEIGSERMLFSGGDKRGTANFVFEDVSILSLVL